MSKSKTATKEDDANFDKQWFEDRLKEAGRTQNGLARHLGVDKSAISRMLAGQRKMRMDEANAIANFIAAPVGLVLKHAGVAMDLDGQPTRVLLAAIINEKGQVEKLAEPRPLPQSVIDRAQAAISKHGNGQIIAAQVRAVTGPLALMDDAVVLFKYTDTVDRGAIGALSICRSYSGEQMMARIDSARKTGEARVICADGKMRELDLHTATPVLAIIP